MANLIKIGAGTIGIDATDVAIVQPRTVGLDTESTLMLARGQNVLSELEPADVVDELDATTGTATPLMCGPYTTLELGAGCYFGGAHAQRVAPTADDLGCIVTFASLPAVITVPAVTVDDMLDDLNATTGGGGGGGGVQLANALEWEPTPTSSNATGLTRGSSAAMLAGFEDSDVKVITCSVSVQGTTTTTGAVSVVIPLPVGFPCDSSTAFAAQGDQGTGEQVDLVAIADGLNLTITLEGTTATGFGVWAIGQYTSGAE